MKTIDELLKMEMWWAPFSWYEHFKLSLLSKEEIFIIMSYIQDERRKGNYTITDNLRDKLIDIGCFWFMPEQVNIGNLRGHKINKLVFKVLKNEMVLYGLVFFEEKMIQDRDYIKLPNGIEDRDTLINLFIHLPI